MFPHSDAVPRSVHGLCVAVGLLFLLGMNSNAQVTIKERVEIGSPGLPNVTRHKVFTNGEAIWVSHWPGVYKLRVFAAWQTLSPISPTAYFQAVTPEGTFTGNITAWTSQPGDQWTGFINQCGGEDTTGWYYSLGGVVPYDRTLAIRVALYDTLRFRYYSDFGASQFSEVYQDPYPEWMIKMWLDHPCIWNIDQCALHLSFFYDTTFTRFDVEALKDTLAHGDTLDFRVVAMSALNQETPLAGDTPLTLRISPSNYGCFLNQSGDTVPSPLINIRYQDAREGRIRFVANATAPGSLQPVAIEAVQMSDTTRRGSDTVWIKPNVIKILLGETKYFRARNHPTQSDKLIIEETEQAVIGTAIADTVWHGAPVSQISGGKIGVYWDRMKATIRTDTLDPVMEDLPTGLVRVIGRYWDRDSTYRVKLVAHHLDRTGETTIEVKCPDRLGNSHSTVTGPTVINGVDSTWNLDSLIIEFAGKEGIFPQFIKAIITNESVGFHPSYRYEPLQDLMNSSAIRPLFDSTHRYWIKSASNLGNPTIPQHNNVRLGDRSTIPYPSYQTIWQFDSTHANLYDTTFYAELAIKARALFESYRDSLRKEGIDSVTVRQQAALLAKKKYVNWLKYEIRKKGMVNTIAQTRIFASYGLMQLTYYSGVRKFRRDWPQYDYPDKNPLYLPEYINIPSINLKYGTLHFKGHLRNALAATHFSVSTWPNGWEKTYWLGSWRYNGMSKVYSRRYANNVFGFVDDYLPMPGN